ncbi:MAG: hypothetical protein LCI02_07370 [Proteobacteria bacterium]|nr:hypothetical protein [Pseudomonadota bacterium]
MSTPPSPAPAPAGPATLLSDPVKAWRDWFVRNEREWSEALTRLMKDDGVARAVGQEINTALHAQQMLAQGMATPLALLNLPTRDDVVALGERIGQLEDAVARIEAALVQALRAGAAGTAGTAHAPARTRQPPKAAKASAARRR